MNARRSLLALPALVPVLLAGACREDGGGSAVPGNLPPEPPETPEPPEPEEPPPTLFTEKDQAEMVYIPPGEFLMGTSDADIARYRVLFPLRDPARFDDERPQRTVFVDGFYIDRLEVTNAQFKRFLAETGHLAPGYLDSPPHNAPDLPAVVLGWADAAAYAAWAGKRLPTEAEWEKAARGTDGRIWPWGDVWDAKKLSGNDGTGLEDGYVQAAPVGSFPQGASPYGVLDMAGNVWEWTADWYLPDYYGQGSNVDPQGPETGDGHVLRGGGWAESFDFTRCANRQGGNPGSLIRGFRCAMDPGG